MISCIQLPKHTFLLKKTLPILVLWLIALSLVGFMIISQTRLCECLSESLDGVRYIIFLKNRTLHHGDLVLIEGHHEDHVGELTKWPFTKRVIGIPGDKILHTKEGIKIKSAKTDGETYLSKALLPLKETSRGKALTPLTSSVVPEGYVFVAGDNPHSFDSRYEEFGLVPIEKIWGRGVFTW